MSFCSDKDLRKGAGVRQTKKPSANSNSSAELKKDELHKNENVVEKARLQRELRAKSREERVFCVKIQSWWRGQSSAWKITAQQRNEFDRKLSDILNLSAMLLNKNKIVFIPPAPICIELAKKLTIFGFHGREDSRRIVKFCSCALLPTLDQMEPSKNFATKICDGNDYTVSRLSNLIIHNCVPKIMKQMGVTEEEVTTILLPCLRLLVGAGEPYKMVYANDLRLSFTAIRSSLLKNGFFRRIRTILIARSEYLVDQIEGEETIHSIRRPLSACSGDQLLSILMFIAVADKSGQTISLTRDRISLLTTDILTVPMVTLLLSEDGIRTLARWESMGQALECISALPPLPPSPRAVFQSEQWLSGNLASLLPYFNILNTSSKCIDDVTSSPKIIPSNEVSSPRNREEEFMSDNALESYLLLIIFFYCNYDVPGVIQGKKGIMWRKEGVSMTAGSIPVGLKFQLLSPLSPSVCSDLFTRILQPVKGCVGEGTAADRENVTTALATSGLVMSQGALSAEQESEVWFSSKWAQRIVSKMTTKARSKVDVLVGSGGSNSTAEQSKGVSEESVVMCKYKENTRLTGALSRLWSVLLPHAIFSPSGDRSGAGGGVGGGGGTGVGGAVVEYKSWRALSLLAFGTTAADRLWVAVEHSSVPLTLTSSKTQASEKSSTYAGTSATSASASNLKSEKGKDTQSKSSGPFSGFMNIFGLSSSSSSTSTSTSSAKKSTYDDKKTSNRTSEPVDSTSFQSFKGSSKSATSTSDVKTSTQDIEVYATRIFTPKIHVEPDSSDFRFSTLVAFASILKTILAATDDYEFYSLQKPFPLVQYVRIIRTFKVLLYSLLKYNPSLASDQINNATDIPDKLYSSGCVRSISGVLSDLYLRWARRPFSAASVWVLDDGDSLDIKNEVRVSSPFAVAILRHMPWTLNFYERMKIFRSFVDDERNAIQKGEVQNKIVVRIRRTHVLLDGMAAFQKAGNGIKDTLYVKYINSFGDEEIGTDLGGLFKDFLTDLSARVFDPSYGLFLATSDNLLYPNPSAILLYPEPGELEALYSFLGRVLGKALFENITIQPQFAHFFLAFMHGRYNFMNLVNDLKTFDDGLYKNLMFLKTYTGDIEDLCLTFSVSETDMGIQKEVDLVHQGSKIPVTSENRHRYIGAIAKYHLYDRLKKQAKAFFGGMYQVIKADLFSIFCAPELQILISGTNSMSLKDLKGYTRYIGYGIYDRNIVRLWSVLEELSAADSALFLKFVTSCERPPSLGFASLQPPFTVQMVVCDTDLRLPTASTCFNTLKLPSYSSKEVLKERLLTSIRSNAGFDLS